MADQQPWDRLKGAMVVDQAPAPDQAQQPSQPAPSGGSAPWERYGKAQVIDAPVPNDVQARSDVAGKTKDWLQNASDSYNYGVEQVVKGTLFGAVVNPIAAYWTLHAPESLGGMSQDLRQKAPNLTYKDVLDVYNKRDAEHSSGGLQFIGALATGGITAKLAMRGAEAAAVRSGVVDGAMQWAAGKPGLQRAVGAAALAGGAGATEAFIRSGLEEAVKTTAGDGFDPGTVVENTLSGAVMGAITGGILQGGLDGGGAAFKWMKAATGMGDAQAQLATERILKHFAGPGEDLNTAAARLAQKHADFIQANGYAPAISDMLPPERVNRLVKDVAQFTGMDEVLRKYADQAEQRALQGYRGAITNGKDIASPEQVRAAAENSYTAMADRYGNLQVDVPDHVISKLADNRDWIQQRANAGNDGAKRILGLLDAQAKLPELRSKLASLRQASSIGGAKSLMADIDQQVQELLAAQASHETDPTRLQALQVLRQQMGAAVRAMTVESNKGKVDFNYRGVQRSVQALEAQLNDYAQNGLKVSFSDANHLRSAASKAAFQNSDFDKRETAQFIRDAMSVVGQREVPGYADQVANWRNQMTRAEAQQTGEITAMGTIDPGDLSVRFGGRAPRKGQGRAAGDQLSASRQGMDEGARRTLRNEVAGGTQSGVRSAVRVAGNENVQKGLQKISPARARQIQQQANQVVHNYKTATVLRSAASPTERQQELAAAKEILGGVFFGTLGGAAKAGLLSRVLANLRIPRGVALKLADMVGDPQQIDAALRYVQSKGIRVKPLAGALAAAMQETSH